VRAAANGVVVLSGTGEDAGGYGVHVVLAHRLPDGSLVYSVYAHLARRSVTVRPGEPVAAGQPLGLVGRTGRATSPHLHFEVRVPDTPEARWEKAQPVDPVAFVAARAPASARDTTWARPWLLWAEAAALLDPARPADAPATRGEWWCTLAAALALGDERPHLDPARARARLEQAGLACGDDEPDAPVTASQLAADLDRGGALGWRLPPAPLGRDSLARAQQRQLGWSRGIQDASRVTGPAIPLTRAAMCLALAGFAPEPRSAPRTPVSGPSATRD
jgi:hypothetical protein